MKEVGGTRAQYEFLAQHTQLHRGLADDNEFSDDLKARTATATSSSLIGTRNKNSIFDFDRRSSFEPHITPISVPVWPPMTVGHVT